MSRRSEVTGKGGSNGNEARKDREKLNEFHVVVFSGVTLEVIPGGRGANKSQLDDRDGL